MRCDDDESSLDRVRTSRGDSHITACKLQANIRRFLVRTRYVRNRRVSAVIRIQREYRGYRDRRDLERKREFENRMAQLVKCLFRGERGRKWAVIRKYQVQAHSRKK